MENEDTHTTSKCSSSQETSDYAKREDCSNSDVWNNNRSHRGEKSSQCKSILETSKESNRGRAEIIDDNSSLPGAYALQFDESLAKVIKKDNSEKNREDRSDEYLKNKSSSTVRTAQNAKLKADNDSSNSQGNGRRNKSLQCNEILGADRDESQGTFEIIDDGAPLPGAQILQFDESLTKVSKEAISEEKEQIHDDSQNHGDSKHSDISQQEIAVQPSIFVVGGGDPEIQDDEIQVPFQNEYNRSSPSIAGESHQPSTYVGPEGEIVIPEATLVSSVHETDGPIVTASVVKPEKYALTIAGRKIRVHFLAMGVLLLVGVAIALSLTLSKKSDAKAPSLQETPISPSLFDLTLAPSFSPYPSFAPSSEPSTSPTSVIFADLVRIIYDNDSDNNSMPFLDGQSPQWIALNWLAEDQSGVPGKEGLDYFGLDIERYTGPPLRDDEIKERYALALLYFGTEGDKWFNSFNFMSSDHVCRWKGKESLERKGVLRCNEYGLVESLELFDNNLKGNLPEEISFLTNLTTLRIENNDISGNLPDTLGSLTRMTHLQVGNNDFIGDIPSSIERLNNLQVLELSNNEFGGRLMNVENWTRLESFKVDGNQFTGEISETFGDLELLESLYLNQNRLSGSVNFLCDDPPTKVQLDCDGDVPEVTCKCCFGCAISNDNECDFKMEKVLKLDILAGFHNDNFRWELARISRTFRDEEYIAVGGEYDDGETISIQLCLPFPGEYALRTTYTRNFDDPIDDGTFKAAGILVTIDIFSHFLRNYDSFYFGFGQDGERYPIFLPPPPPPPFIFPPPPPAPIPGCITFRLFLTTDSFGDETSWRLINENTGMTEISGDSYESNTTISSSKCLSRDGCYVFIIEDSFDDGICCEYGNGHYNVSFNERLIGQGGDFESSETVSLGGSCGIDPMDGFTCPDGYSIIEVNIMTDEFGFDTHWELTNAITGATVLISDFGLANLQLYLLFKCIPSNGCYTFAIHDRNSDGLGDGAFYQLRYEGEEVIFGNGDFGQSDSRQFGNSCQ